MSLYKKENYLYFNLLTRIKRTCSFHNIKFMLTKIKISRYSNKSVNWVEKFKKSLIYDYGFVVIFKSYEILGNVAFYF